MRSLMLLLMKWRWHCRLRNKLHCIIATQVKTWWCWVTKGWNPMYYLLLVLLAGPWVVWQTTARIDTSRTTKHVSPVMTLQHLECLMVASLGFHTQSFRWLQTTRSFHLVGLSFLERSPTTECMHWGGPITHHAPTRYMILREPKLVRSTV